MRKRFEMKKETQFHVKIQSTVHKYHTIQVNLRCYEKMPSEEALQKSTVQSRNIPENKNKK